MVWYFCVGIHHYDDVLIMLQDDWLRRAELAVQKGEDELAKEALKRRKGYQVRCLQNLAHVSINVTLHCNLLFPGGRRFNGQCDTFRVQITSCFRRSANFQSQFLNAQNILKGPGAIIGILF